MIKTALFSVALLFTPLIAQPAFADHKHGVVEFSLGVVPQFEQRKLFKIWQPIVSELEKRTGFSIHIVGSPKIPAFEKKFLTGEYDFAYMNSYHVLKAHKTQGYEPLLKDGSRKLKGILVVKKDSPIKSVAELDKKMIAFPSPNALGASLLMRADLKTLHGLDIVPRYVQTHSSVYLNVALGQTVAGGGVMSTLNAQKDDLKNHLRILYQTREMAPHPLAVHPRVSKEHREQFRQAWLDLAKTEEGHALLSKIPMRQSVSAGMADYEPMLEWGLEAFYVTD